MENNKINSQLQKVREEIDKIDSELITLFIKRLECAKKVAEIKRENNLPVLNSAREQEIIEMVKSKSGELGEFTAEIFKDIMKVSKDYQKFLLEKEDK